MVPGLGLRLPSEAEWEYACRAGTTTATYAGPIDIRGANNAPVLDAIAWYGGNSGVGYDLAEAIDSSGWPEKQYAHERAGTRPVKTRRRNPWGLYDMLGNVWEWCPGPERGAEGTGRVLRGGSWADDARLARAASRDAGVPSLADGSVGFRLSRGRAPGGSPAEPASAGGPAGRGAQAGPVRGRPE